MTTQTLDAQSLKTKIASEIVLARDTGATRRIGDSDGLTLVVRANGRAEWVLRHRHFESRTDLTLGRWPAISLGEARAAAVDARRRLTGGEDLGAKRKVVRAEVAAVAVPSDTLRELVDEWIDKVHHEASPVIEKKRWRTLRANCCEVRLDREVSRHLRDDNDVRVAVGLGRRTAQDAQA